MSLGGGWQGGLGLTWALQGECRVESELAEMGSGGGAEKGPLLANTPGWGPGRDGIGGAEKVAGPTHRNQGWPRGGTLTAGGRPGGCTLDTGRRCGVGLWRERCEKLRAGAPATCWVWAQKPKGGPGQWGFRRVAPSATHRLAPATTQPDAVSRWSWAGQHRCPGPLRTPPGPEPGPSTCPQSTREVPASLWSHSFLHLPLTGPTSSLPTDPNPPFEAKILPAQHASRG